MSIHTVHVLVSKIVKHLKINAAPTPSNQPATGRSGQFQKHSCNSSGVWYVLLLTLSIITTELAAEVTTDSYSCQLGNEIRTINLTYLNGPETLPCEIRVSKNNKAFDTLWRAENDSTFCSRQFIAFRQKQEGLGWLCETQMSASTLPADASNGAEEPTLESSAISPGATAAFPAPGTGPAQVTILENSLDTALSQRSPQAPGGKYGNLTPEDIREMDDWLIYLSAQTMASIRSLTPNGDAFEAYQKREAITASNIYERLQSRIEFLNSLTANPTAPAGLSQTNF